jgi:hypothetical protein
MKMNCISCRSGKNLWISSEEIIAERLKTGLPVTISKQRLSSNSIQFIFTILPKKLMLNLLANPVLQGA